MKLRSVPVKGYENIIVAIGDTALFTHMIGGLWQVRDCPEHWKHIERMCQAHNEPFERIE